MIDFLFQIIQIDDTLDAFVQSIIENIENYDSEESEVGGDPHWTSYIPGALIAGGVLALLLYFIGKVVFEAVGLGTFSSFYKKTPENVRFTYKVLGCHIIYAEYDKLDDQLNYLISYLKSRFPEIDKLETADIRKLVRFYPNIRKPLNWANINFNEGEKTQLIDFLVDLGFYNDTLNRREHKLIHFIGKSIGVSKSHIDSLLRMRHNFYRQKRERERKRRRESYTNQRSSVRLNKRQKINNKLKILEINNQNATFEDVKKAYRKLARKLHPDRFHRADESEKKMAHERFTQINLAYEFLETEMNK